MTSVNPRLPPDSREEKAVRFLIADHTATYRQAAERFSVSINSVRSRVEYRFGSLEMARTFAAEEFQHLKDQKRCAVCRTPQPLDRQSYVCRACRGDHQFKGDI